MNIDLLEANNKLDKLRAEKETCFDLFKAYTVDTKGLVDENSKYNRENTRLEKLSEWYRETIALREKSISDNKIEIDRLNKALDEYKEHLDKIRGEMEEKASYEKEALVNEANEERERLVSEASEEREKLENEINELNEKLSGLDSEKSDLENEVRGLEDKVEKLKEENSALKEKNSILEDERDGLIGKSEILRNRLSSLEEENKKLSNSDGSRHIIEELKDNRDSLIEELKRAEENSRVREHSLNEHIKQVTLSNSEMAGKIKSLEKKLSEFKSNHYKEKYEPKIEKCAGVKVISVSGSGGSGITTLAVSIAKELGKLDHKVCVIDMDIPSSDCDGFFNVNGIIRDSLSSLDLLAKGSWCTDDIVNIPCGSLVSGFRSKKKLDWKKSDWDKMFKELSESGDYEYFVVDLGNLGVSEDIDNLIKAVYGISDSFLVSCDNDDYRCTNLIRKMLALKMSGFVVLNRCVNSKACNIVSMHDIDNMMIPFEIDIFGVRDSLALGSLSKRKLQGLIERVM